MLTVGQILKQTRIRNHIALDDVEKHTRIRKKYLQAIEDNNFDRLPGRTYIIGFIENYCDYLNLDTHRVLAIFRREYPQYNQPPILPKGLREPPVVSFAITPRIAAVTASIVLLLVFFTYLLNEYRFIAFAPALSIDQPRNGQIIQGKMITVRGKSDTDTEVRINNQLINTQPDGSFSVAINLNIGINTITVQSRNKFGKEAIIQRTIEIKGESLKNSE